LSVEAGIATPAAFRVREFTYHAVQIIIARAFNRYLSASAQHQQCYELKPDWHV
jgi:hypothetical protein